MIQRFRTDPAIGNVLALAALFVALGGGAYAAFKLPADSVRSKHIKDGQVKSKDVRDNTLSGADIDESQLGQVPDASNLDGNDSSAFLGANSKAVDADELDGFDSSAFALKGAEPWQRMTVLESCGWNASEADAPSAFVDSTGMIHLRGRVRYMGGRETCNHHFADLAVASTPQGMVADAYYRFMVASYDTGFVHTPALLEAHPWLDRTMILWMGNEAPVVGHYYDLDNISFRCQAETEACP